MSKGYRNASIDKQGSLFVPSRKMYECCDGNQIYEQGRRGIRYWSLLGRSVRGAEETGASGTRHEDESSVSWGIAAPAARSKDTRFLGRG